MKKALLICLIVMISVCVKAEEQTFEKRCTSANGVVVAGKNGKVYCKSNRYMNWWTALGWCQAIGMVPFENPNDCRCIGENCPETASGCPNLTGVGAGTVWTGTPFNGNPGYSITINLGNGNVGAHHNSADYPDLALCY